MEIIKNIIKNTVWGIGLLLLCSIFLSRMFLIYNLDAEATRQPDMVAYLLVDIAMLLVAVGILLLLAKKKIPIHNNHLIYFTLFALNVAVGVAVTFMFRYEPIVDQALIISMAKFSLTDSLQNMSAGVVEYIMRHPYQYFYLQIIKVIFSVFGSGNTIAIRLIQVVICSIGSLYTYRTITLLSGKKATNVPIIMILITVFWIIPQIYASHIYGFCIGLSLSQFAVYHYLKFFMNHSKKSLGLCLIGIFTALLVKPNYLIVLVAMALHYLFYSDSKVLIRIVVCACFAVLYPLQGFTIRGLSIAIDGFDIGKGQPVTSWLIMGGVPTSEESVDRYGNTLPGQWNGYVDELPFEIDGNNEELDEILQHDLSAQINYIPSHPKETLEYYSVKSLITWNSIDYGAKYELHSIPSGETENVFEESLVNGPMKVIINEFSLLASFFIFLGAGYLISKHRKNREYALFYITFIGFYLYYLLFETRAIYVYPAVTLLLPISVLGINELTENIRTIHLSKIGKRVSIFMVSILLLFAIVFNIKDASFLFFENYTNTSESISVNEQTIIQQTFILDEERNISEIEFFGDGDLKDNQLVVQISQNGKVISYGIVQASDITSWSVQMCNIPDTKLTAGTYSVDFKLLDDSPVDFVVYKGVSSTDGAPTVTVDGEVQDNESISFKLYYSKKVYGSYYNSETPAKKVIEGMYYYK